MITYRIISHSFFPFPVSHNSPVIRDTVHGVFLPPFPKTYGKSYFYMKLTDSELEEREKELDTWMRAILVNFGRLPFHTQMAILKFLFSGRSLSRSHLTILDILQLYVHAF